MNLTSKQRAYLGSEASTMNAIFQIGKASLTPELINGLDEALEKRELIKISVLKNCADDPREIAGIIAERTHSVIVKVIGKKIILFRQAKKNSKLLEANDLIAQRFGEGAVRFGHEMRTYSDTTGSSAKNPEDYKD